jgi:hypothetical protein
MLSSANVVQWVGQLEGARPLWGAEDVAPLVAHVADDDIAGILQPLALAGLVADGSDLDAEGLEQQFLPARVALVVEVLHGDVPLVFGTACQEHWLNAERDDLVEQPLRLRQRRRAPLQHVLVEARRVVQLSAMKELNK